MAQAQTQARDEFFDRLGELHRRAGEPAAHRLRSAFPPRRATDLPDATLEGWLKRQTVPRNADQLKLLIQAYERLLRAKYGQAVGPHLPLTDWEQWRVLHRNARAAGVREEHPKIPHEPGTTAEDEWATAVADCVAWSRCGTGEVTEALKEQAEQTVRALARRRREDHRALDGDPWLDEGLAVRIAEQLSGMLVNELSQLALSPPEAALLALLPFLYQTQRASGAAELAGVGATDLAQSDDPGQDRRGYETFLRSHERIVRRANGIGRQDAQDGKGAQDAGNAGEGQRHISWWLFHQWAGRRRVTTDAVLDAAAVGGNSRDDIWAVLEREPLARLLTGVSVPPHDLCGTGRGAFVWGDDYYPPLRGYEHQAVRERLVGLVLAVAHARAVELTALPFTIVKHLGIPDPVDLARLADDVAAARWQPIARGDGMQLSARCHHPAVADALAEHCTRVDLLLRLARRTEGLTPLPPYATADGVWEVDENGRRVSAGATVRFRLDEERVQELLMGESLYQDRALAVREMYQNALDACRYRRAREELHVQEFNRGATDRTSGYRGRIEFDQGVDGNGRSYLECTDDGIGMGEAELSGIFAQAGVRFTDGANFHQEFAEWKRHGIAFYPNSRFGIGVLSYFMLADAIRVTTCRMGHGSVPGNELVAFISGPNTFFRIRDTGAPGKIGTTVRLYLREGADAPSCVAELRRLLGIAEFETVARHGTQKRTWRPGVLEERRDLVSDSLGLDAQGWQIPWEGDAGGTGAQVVWCERGGGLLVDGIPTRPRVRRGVLASLESGGTLCGVVVNLVGGHRPERLSVDRTEILDEDICERVEELIRGALPTLLEWRDDAGESRVSDKWLTYVSRTSLRVGDLITERAVAEYRNSDCPVIARIARSGFFLVDRRILSGGMEDMDGRHGVGIPEDVLLWRLISHGPSWKLDALGELVPETLNLGEVVPALPSDRVILSEENEIGSIKGWYRSLGEPDRLLEAALKRGTSYADTVARARVLGISDLPAVRCGVMGDELDLALMRMESGLEYPYTRGLQVSEAVPPGFVVKAYFTFNISVREIIRRLDAFGFDVPDVERFPAYPSEQALSLLGNSSGFDSDWLAADRPVPLSYVFTAAGEASLSASQVVAELREYGLELDGKQSPSEEQWEALEFAGDLYRELAVMWNFGGMLGPREIGKFSARFGLGSREARDQLDSLGVRVLPQVPESIEEDDHRILGAFSHWERLLPGSTVSAFSVVRAAADACLPLAQVESRVLAYGMRIAGDTRRIGAEDLEVASAHFDGDYGWMSSEGSVSPISVMHASAQFGLPLRQVAEVLERCDLCPPRGVVFGEGRASEDDIRIVGACLDGYSPWSSQEGPASPGHVLHAAGAFGVSPADVVEILRRCGYRIPEGFCPDEEQADEVDLRLLSKNIDGSSPWLDGEEPVSKLHLIEVADEVGLPPEQLVTRLAKWGMSTSAEFPVETGALARSLLAIRVQGPEYRTCVLRRLVGTPVQTYLELVDRSGAEPAEVIDCLADLGFDLEALRQSIRESLSEVPFVEK
ncbi:hypothetical protein ACH4SP_06300 [Streptomyces sp. NPDC021093]|uniref:wHTH domain-containing protein n=1 Tax=Streptomyces sp. NPDC021093 TaxID=3365112 RepID=UPI0037AD8345